MAASPDVLGLSAGALRAEVVPERGGRVTGFWVETPGGPIDLIAPIAPAAVDPDGGGRGGCYALAPFSNRIADAHFVWRGRAIRLRPHPGAAPHALHGLAWARPFEVVTDSPRVVRLRHDHAGDDAWPFALRLIQEIRLNETGLTLALTVENRDRVVQPVGLGFHPFFPRRSDARLTFAAGAMWAETAGRIPRQLGPIPPDLDFAAGRTPPVGLDHLYEDVEGRRAAIVWPGAGLSLSLVASAGLGRAVVFSPSEGDLFCWEPVSHPIDAIRLPGAPGLFRVAPGRARRATLRLKLAYL
jgi:aldose 1-epimerase